MRKSAFSICETKGYLAIFCGCTACFVSDLVGIPAHWQSAYHNVPQPNRVEHILRCRTIQTRPCNPGISWRSYIPEATTAGSKGDSVLTLELKRNRRRSILLLCLYRLVELRLLDLLVVFPGNTIY